MPAQHILEDRKAVSEIHDETLQNYIWELRRQIRELPGLDFARTHSLMGLLKAEQVKREKAAEEQDDDLDDDEHDSEGGAIEF